MAEVAGSLKEDFEEKLEVEVAMMEERFPWFYGYGKRFRWLSWSWGGEVKGGGVDFEVSRILLGVIPRDIIGESGGEAFGVDRGAG
ncbi:hypothetical protein Tco_0292011 [Tanacetum coccineum]